MFTVYNMSPQICAEVECEDSKQLSLLGWGQEILKATKD